MDRRITTPFYRFDIFQKGRRTLPIDQIRYHTRRLADLGRGLPAAPSSAAT